MGKVTQAMRKVRKMNFARELVMSSCSDGVVGVSSGTAEPTGVTCTASAIEDKAPGTPSTREGCTSGEKVISEACDSLGFERTKSEPSEKPRMVVLVGAGGVGKTTIATMLVAREGLRASLPVEVPWLLVGKGAENRLSALTSDTAEIIKSCSPPRGADDHINTEDRKVVEDSDRCLLVVTDDVWEVKELQELEKDGVWVLFATSEDKLLPGNPPLQVDEVLAEEAEMVPRALIELDEEMKFGKAADDPKTAPSQLRVAKKDLVGGESGWLGEAETLLRRALAIGKEKLRDGDPLSLALFLCFLGMCVVRTGRLEGTKELLQGAFMRVECLGHYHLKKALLYYLMFGAHRSERAEKGKKIFRRAVELFQQKFGSDHLDVTDNLITLGMFASAAGPGGQAEDDCRRDLVMRQPELGTQHLKMESTPDTLGARAQTARRMEEGEGPPKKHQSVAIDHEVATCSGVNMIEKYSPDHHQGSKVPGFMNQPSKCILRKAEREGANYGHVLANAKKIGLPQSDQRPPLEEVMFCYTALSLSWCLEAGIGQGDGHELARQILIRQVFDGLVYIHSKDICHQDMSLENVSTARMGDVEIVVDENGITLFDHLTGGCPRVLSAWIVSPWLITWALSKGILRSRGPKYSDPSRHSVDTGSEALKLLNMSQLLNYMHLKFFGPYSHSMSSSLLQPSIGTVFNKHLDFYGMRGKASKGNGDATRSTQNQELPKASTETLSLQDWRLYLLGVCVEMWYTVAWCSNHMRLLALHHNKLLGRSGEVHHRGTAARVLRGMSAPWSSSTLGIMTAAGSVSCVTATSHLGAGLDPAVSAFLRWLCQAHWSVHGLIYALAGVTLYKGIVFFIHEIKAGNAEFSATLQELRQAKQAVIARKKGRSRNSS